MIDRWRQIDDGTFRKNGLTLLPCGTPLPFKSLIDYFLIIREKCVFSFECRIVSNILCITIISRIMLHISLVDNLFKFIRWRRLSIRRQRL